MNIDQAICCVLQVYEHWPHRQQQRLAARVKSNPSAAQVHQQQCGGLTTDGCPSAGGMTTAWAEWTAVAHAGGTGCTLPSRVRQRLTWAAWWGAVAMAAAMRGHVLRLHVRGHGFLAVATAGSCAWPWAAALYRGGRCVWPWAPGCGFSRQLCVAMGCGFV